MASGPLYHRVDLVDALQLSLTCPIREVVEGSPGCAASNETFLIQLIRATS